MIAICDLSSSNIEKLINKLSDENKELVLDMIDDFLDKHRSHHVVADISKNAYKREDEGRI